MKYKPGLSEEEIFTIGRAIFRCEKKWLGTYQIVCKKLNSDGNFYRAGRAQYGNRNIKSVFYRYIGAA